jgi:hypothetical protein
VRRVLVFAAALALLGASRGHSSLASSAPSAPVRPTVIFWAWERSEDLRFLARGGGASAPHVRVAFLDRTLRFDDGRPSVHYRQQPLLVSPETSLTSVVRVETRGRAPKVSQADDAASLVVKALHAPRTTALQIDFDARRSDRAFYRAERQPVQFVTLVARLKPGPTYSSSLPRVQSPKSRVQNLESKV